MLNMLMHRVNYIEVPDKDRTGDHGPGSRWGLSGGEFCTAPPFIVKISCKYQVVRLMVPMKN